MNSLSWMIYGAGVADSISGGLTFIAVASGFATVGIGVVAATLTFDRPYLRFLGSDEKAAKEAKWAANTKLAQKLVARLAGTCIAAIMVASLIPSSKTIYAIAASEVGEKALASPAADKAMQALNVWLDKQIKAQK